MTGVQEGLDEAAAVEGSPVLDADPLTKPAATPGEWARVNLFSSPLNALVTVVFAVLIGWVAFRVGRFVLVTAEWEIIRVNLASFMVGQFPRDRLIFPAVAVGIISFASGVSVGPGAGLASRGERLDLARRVAPVTVLMVVLLAMTQTAGPAIVTLASVAAFFVGRLIGQRLPPRARRYSAVVFVAGLVIGYLVISRVGGVTWNGFGGFMLNLFLAISAITLCFPFGVLLALGRRSTFPAVRAVCVGYIELIRGVPLITLLLLGQTMLGFFLAPGADRPGAVTRALVAFVLFAGAYVAEDVRGGLQSVPRGQIEAARAIGLSPIKTTALIVLPQALRNVIPALVGQFISLTKDTALVAIIGTLDILRVARVVTGQQAFVGQGLQTETLLFAGFCFWAVAFTMSRASQRLEKRLGVGVR